MRVPSVSGVIDLLAQTEVLIQQHLFQRLPIEELLVILRTASRCIPSLKQQAGQVVVDLALPCIRDTETVIEGPEREVGDGRVEEVLAP